MSKRSQDKRKARAKEKAHNARRERGRSRWDNLVGDDSGVECWLQFDSEGLDPMESLIVFRKVRSGGHVAAFFLIDYLCIGLKDVCCHADVVPSEMIEKCRSQLWSKVQRMSVDEMRSTVAAAIRWAREHDFRLPTELQRGLKVLGGTVSSENADTSEFGAEGEDGRRGSCLHYVGLKNDLKKRLLNETLEGFLAREDVTADFMDDEEYDDDEYDDDEADDDEEPEESVRDDLIMELLEEVPEWCQQHGLTVAKELREAAILHTSALMRVLPRLAEDMEKGERKTPNTAIDDTVRELFENADYGERKQAVWDAYEQVRVYLRSPERERKVEAANEREMAENVKQITQKTLAAMKQWCLASGQKPHPLLEEAISLILTAASQAMEKVEGGEDDPDSPEVLEAAEKARERLLALEPEEKQQELIAAMLQHADFVDSFKDQGELFEMMNSDD